MYEWTMHRHAQIIGILVMPWESLDVHIFGLTWSYKRSYALLGLHMNAYMIFMTLYDIVYEPSEDLSLIRL